MEDSKKSIEVLVNKGILVDKNSLNEKIIRKVIFDIKKAIDDNKEKFLLANKIDLKNKNGKMINFEVVDNIFKNIGKEDIFYGKVIMSKKDNAKVYGRQYFDRGNGLVFNKGEFYVILELFLKNFLVGNTVIFVSNGYMYGVDNLLVTIIKTVLTQNGLSENFINLIEFADDVLALEEWANVDYCVVVGRRDEQRKIISRAKVPVLASGYFSYDMYIDDMVDEDFIGKILKTGLDINVYVNENLKIDGSFSMIDKALSMVVSGIDEAIAAINYNGNGYSSVIFTKDMKNAGDFLNKVKSSIVMVNTSPEIENLMDIKTGDLARLKTIIYSHKEKNKR